MLSIASCLSKNNNVSIFWDPEKEESIITQWKISRIKKIICNSAFTKSYIDKKFRVNSLVLYPPVEIPKTSAVEKENIILNVGRFGRSNEGEYYKKQDLLIQSFVRMH